MDVFLSLFVDPSPLALLARGVLLLGALAAVSPLLRRPEARHDLWLGGIVALFVLPFVSLPLELLPASPDVLPLATSSVAVSTRASVPGELSAAGGGIGFEALLALVWWLGVAVVAGRVTLRHLYMSGVSRRAVPAGASWDREVQAAAARLRRCVRVRISPEIDGPLVWGTLRPVILLPTSARCWPAAVGRSVLLHELAHVRRFDALAGLIGALACVLHWPNPFVWLAARRLRALREFACDLAAVSAGIARPDYSDHLVTVARLARSSHAPALAMAEGQSLRDRVVHVLGAPIRSRVASWGPAAACLAIIVPCTALRPVAAELPLPSATLALAPLAVEEADPAIPEPLPRRHAVPEALAAPEPPEPATPEGALVSAAPAPRALAPRAPAEVPVLSAQAIPEPTALDLPSELGIGDAWSFSLDEPSWARIVLYALDGELVTVLADGRFESGRHRFVLGAVSPGAYVAGARLGDTARLQRVRVTGSVP